MELNRRLRQKRRAPGRAAPPGGEAGAGAAAAAPPDKGASPALTCPAAAAPAEPLGHNTYLPTVEPQRGVVGAQQGR